MTTRPGVRLTDDGLGQLYREDLGAQGGGGAHPSEDDWIALTSNTVEQGLRDRMADHVVGCAECAAIHRALTDLRREASDIDPAAPALANASSTPWWLGYGAVAAAALVVVTATAALLSRPEQGTSASAPPSTAASTPALPAASAPPAPWATSVVAIDVRLPVSLVMTLRGEAASDAVQRQDLVRQLRPALDLYRRAAYADAAAALTPIAAAHPDVTEVAFYAGLSYLLAGDAVRALPLLESATGSELVGDDARWFTAVAHERLGAHGRATDLLREVCAQAGPRASAACQVSQAPAR